MDFLKAAGHLLREIGDEAFTVLVDPKNTGKVRELIRKLVEESIPNMMVIDGVAYEILSFHDGDEETIKGHELVSRVSKLKANHSKSDRQLVLTKQKDIPVAVRGKVLFVFIGDKSEGDPDLVCCISWYGFRWIEDWCGRDVILSRNCRVLRRKEPTNSEV